MGWGSGVWPTLILKGTQGKKLMFRCISWGREEVSLEGLGVKELELQAGKSLGQDSMPRSLWARPTAGPRLKGPGDADPLICQGRKQASRADAF